MKKYKRIILVGKAASGKDHARKLLEEYGLRYCVSHTTRPPREGEVNGIDYHFASMDSLNFEYLQKARMYEWVYFNGWFYGTSNDEFNKSNLFIMTPGGISKLKPEDRLDSIIVYIDIDIETRKERLLKRNDADRVDRRLESDEKDFENFTDFDHKIDNPNFDIDEILGISEIRNYLEDYDKHMYRR
jgi:guanylate kinase